MSLIDPDSDNTRWFVAYTNHHTEQQALHHIQAQKFTAFCPMIKKSVRHARYQRSVKVPLFPRYVFVKMDIERTQWRSINGTVGVSHLITMNNRPVPVCDGFVEALAEAADTAGLVRLDRDLKKGDKVKLLTGPFAGNIGEFLRVDAKGRVMILMQAMGLNVSVRVDRQSLMYT